VPVGDADGVAAEVLGATSDGVSADGDDAGGAAQAQSSRSEAIAGGVRRR
jgi:hypothetical protein